MIRIGVCPKCRADIVEMPTPDGRVVLDTSEFVIDDVDPADRFIAFNTSLNVESESTASRVLTCMRRHHCATPPTGLATALDRPQLRPPGRTDYIALREIRTKIELYRAQEVGRLRQHPGQRTYEIVLISPRLADLGRFRSGVCVLCGRTQVQNTLIVAMVDAEPAWSLRVCRSTCTAVPR